MTSHLYKSVNKNFQTEHSLISQYNSTTVIISYLKHGKKNIT